MFAAPIVLSKERFRFIVAQQLLEIGASETKIFLEPVGRNTAPAACIAALFAERSDPDSVMLLVPSDHVIADPGKFRETIARGLEAALDGMLVTFGVKPDRPHTGYGYIEIEPANNPVLAVSRFIEKPSLEAAKGYLLTDRVYWNSGMFLVKASTMVALMEDHAPQIVAACRAALDNSVEDLDFLRLGAAYAEASAISLDYAIAEKAIGLRLVPLRTSWSDVGSWSAIWNLMRKDQSNNVVQGEALITDTTGSYVHSTDSCVAVVGMQDVIVVATKDGVLVTSKARAESVKDVFAQLKASGWKRALFSNRSYRPWGWYETLHRSERSHVKSIMVMPGGKLSLQSHFHRSEHWVVINGTVEVTMGDEVQLLGENEATFIPLGKPHRLANPGKVPALLIEVQFGPYLEEDDIIRFEDVYGRTDTDARS
jgi:mannose-1-phosphate guanylyltransferase/mannose-1-phosphate guanylyltransferase/mannose-6-phosphate isomerase